ncbi:hypothetical protein S40288_01627, partial [Stachybotrys chartarum IBT 40288]
MDLWFLATLTGAYFIIIVLLLSETQRKVVGDGGIKAQGLYRSLFDYFIRDRVAENNNELLSKRKHRFPNPFNCVVMLFDKGNFTVILAGSITYAVKMTLQTSLAAQVMEIYALNHLETGLTYLPSAIGGAMASYVTGRCFPTRLLACAEFHVVGKLLDKNVKKMAAQLGRDGVYRRGDDILDFPIERARLTGLYSLVSLSSTSTIGYGISLMTRSSHSSCNSLAAVQPLAYSQYYTSTDAMYYFVCVNKPCADMWNPLDRHKSKRVGDGSSVVQYTTLRRCWRLDCGSAAIGRCSGSRMVLRSFWYHHDDGSAVGVDFEEIRDGVEKLLGKARVAKGFVWGALGFQIYLVGTDIRRLWRGMQELRALHRGSTDTTNAEGAHQWPR